MNERIQALLARLEAAEEELRAALHEQQGRVLFRVRGKRVEFEAEVMARHRALRRRLLAWVLETRPQNFLTAPFVYGLIVPLAFLDLAVTLYQAVSFPIYRIAKVRRGDFIVIDRQHLAYLNGMEKLHCMYCGYANGLIAYVREVAARTEQYFCPIKHARKVLGSHARYARFLDYGDASAYPDRLESFRERLAAERSVDKDQRAKAPEG